MSEPVATAPKTSNLRLVVRLIGLAARNIGHNKRRALLAALSVMLGVLAVTSLRGTLNGLQQALRQEAVASQIGALQIHRTGYMAKIIGTPLDLDFSVDKVFLDKVRAVDGVQAVAPRIAFGAMVSMGEQTTFSLLTAIDPAAEAEVCPLRQDRLTSGRLMLPSEKDRLVLSAELARRLGAKIDQGDAGRVAVLSNDRDGSLNAVDTHVVGLNGLPGSPGLETRLGVMQLSHAQELLRMEGKATEVAVAVRAIEDVDSVRDRLQAMLGPEYEVSTWKVLARTVAEATALQNQVLGIITAILMVVALLGIVNTMLMSVLERTREIGVMLALGMRRSKIVLLILAEASIIAAAAALPGLAGGTLIVRILGQRGIEFTAPGGGLLHLHPFVTASESLLVVALACGGATIAAVYPAWRASLLRPVEALAHT